MSSTTTPVIGLFKPVPGTAEPFRVADLNDNMDLLDAAYGTIGESIFNIEQSVAAAEEVSAAAAEAATNANNVAAESAEALVQFEIDSANAIAELDTDAIISAIITEEFSLDIDGGTA
jgi:hypothetical protein